MLTKQSKAKVMVIYIVIPLVFLSLCVSTVVFTETAMERQSVLNSERIHALHKLSLTKHPLGLMSYESTGDLYNEMNSVKGVFDEQNDRNLQKYGDTPLTISVAKGESATLDTLKSYFSSQERVHVSSHGYIETVYEYHDGIRDKIDQPVIKLHGQYLSVGNINRWTKIDGRCQLLYLSACYSMGKTNDGGINDRLAKAIMGKTSVHAVLGFKGPVDVLAATILSQKFWKNHVAYSTTGGISAEHSYEQVKEAVSACLVALPILTGAAIGVIASSIIALAESGIGIEFVGALVAELVNLVAWETALAGLSDALNGWVLLGDGVSVPGLSWTYGGGGGSASKPIVTVC